MLKKYNLIHLSKLTVGGIGAVVAVFSLGDFFSLLGFYSPGDVLFPFNLEKAVMARLSPWDFSALGGLGIGEGYKSPSIAIYLALIAIFNKIGLSLEVCNRIYIALPYFLLGASLAHLIDLITKSKVNHIVVAIASAFFVTSLPFTTIDPILTLGWAFLIYLISILPRSFEKRRFSLGELILAVIAIAYLSVLPRLIILFIIYIAINSIFYKKLIYRYLRILILSGMFALPVYLYSIFPLVFSINSGSGFIDGYLKMNRIDVINFYAGGVSLSKTMLLHYSNQYSMYESLFKEPSVILASIILLFIVYLGFFSNFGRDYKSKKYLLLNLLVFASLSSIFGTTVYNFFILNIPGFWIINNPQYIISIVAIFWTALLVFGLNFALNKIKDRSNRVLFIILIITSICSMNRIMIFNKINLSSKVVLGQNNKYYSPPKYVDDFLSSIDCKYQKILFLPKSSDGYYTYRFWTVSGMPNIFSNSLCLNSFSLSDRVVELLKSKKIDLFEPVNSLNISALIDLGVKYIAISNDVIESDYEKNIALEKSTLKALEESQNAKLRFKNESITIFELDSIPDYVILYNEFDKNYIEPIRERNLIFKFSNLSENSNYKLQTYFPKYSDWAYYLSNNENLSLNDEIKMLFSEINSINFINSKIFKNWNLNTSKNLILRVYLKNNITNYYKLILVVLSFYYVFLLLIIYAIRKKFN